MSQPAFAEMVGVSPSTILSIENGRLALSHKLARRISLVTGVNLAQLLEGRGGKLLNSDYKTYRLSDYQNWSRCYDQSDDPIAPELALDLAEKIKKLLNSAAKADRLRVTHARLLDAITQARNALRLGSHESKRG